IYSDGLHTPEELMQMAVENGLKAFSITDHDSIEALGQVQPNENITFIPGVEITSTVNNREVHILGYYIRPEDPKLVETLAAIAQKRKVRLLSMVEKLNKAFGIGMDIGELIESFGQKAYNRMNLARLMVERGISPSIKGCFAKYLGDENEVYEAVNYFAPEEAVKVIHESGGLAFIAHPYLINEPRIIPELVEQGIDGIEVFHPSHRPDEIRIGLEWAARFNLGVSGGSDFHGNDNSKRKLLAAGLTGERLVDFLSLNPNRDFVIA
ncbi:MAG: hypothetical protein V3S46_04575, partial [Nitrospinota bacterium]